MVTWNSFINHASVTVFVNLGVINWYPRAPKPCNFMDAALSAQHPRSSGCLWWEPTKEWRVSDVAEYVLEYPSDVEYMQWFYAFSIAPNLPVSQAPAAPRPASAFHDRRSSAKASHRRDRRWRQEVYDSLASALALASALSILGTPQSHILNDSSR